MKEPCDTWGCPLRGVSYTCVNAQLFQYPVCQCVGKQPDIVKIAISGILALLHHFDHCICDYDAEHAGSAV